jgi:DNA-binding beta-propeller fold protein YncE
MKSLCCWIAVLALQCLVVGGVRAVPPYAYMFDENKRNLVAIDRGGKVVKSVSIESLMGEETNFFPQGSLVISPDSRTLYMEFIEDAWFMYPSSVMLSVDLSTMTPIRWLWNTYSPFEIGYSYFTVSPDGTRLFILYGDYSMRILSLPDGDLLGEIKLDQYPNMAAISPGGHRLYVWTNTGVYRVDLDNNQILDFTSLDIFPSGDYFDIDVTLTADGSTAYVLAGNTSSVSVLASISTRDWRVNWTMELSPGVGNVIVNRAGDRVYVTHDTNFVTVVDTRDRKIVSRIPVGAEARAMAFMSDERGERLLFVISYDLFSVVVVDTSSAAGPVKGFGGVGGKNFIASESDSLPAAKEFYHEKFDHYFLTNSLVEIDALNAGLFEGWKPTGQTVSIFPQAAGAGSIPVCRYFSAAFAPKSSHFYALRGGDCEAVPNFPGWQYEGEVFFAAQPNASGQCPAGAMPLYRVYNNGMGDAPAHRFTTSVSIRNDMVTAGWIPEGKGDGVGMCVPE